MRPHAVRLVPPLVLVAGLAFHAACGYRWVGSPVRDAFGTTLAIESFVSLAPEPRAAVLFEIAFRSEALRRGHFDIMSMETDPDALARMPARRR